jgi:amino acid adenylation domain-containing protein
MTRSTVDASGPLDRLDVIAAGTPQAPAVWSPAGGMTHAALIEHADRLARGLAGYGIGPDDVVALCLPRGIDLVVAVVGILRAGAAFFPVETGQPPYRMTDLIVRSGARLVLTAAGEDRPIHAGPPVRTLAEVARTGGSTGARPAGYDDGLAYVIATSGSTGSPKLVAVPRRAVANHIRAFSGLLGLRAGDRVLQFANPAFDVAIEEILPTLLAGGCVVVPPENLSGPQSLNDLIDDQAVTVVNLPGSYWQLWAGQQATAPPPASLRLVVVGSEPVATATVADFRRRTGLPVVVAYGVTESTITSLVYPFEAADGPGVAPVGTAIDGAEALVLDGSMTEVPDGTAGELYLGGAGLARGYLGRAGLTAERYLPHPNRPGARVYRTGDAAVRRPDGIIELRGRLDEQLKLRGYRIEPAEIVAALTTHPAIADGFVAADGNRLVAYLVPRDPRQVPAPEQLRTHLLARLPRRMLPNRYVIVAALPRLPSGKVDRAALPEPAREPGTIARYRSPSGRLARRVAEVWAEVLGVPRIGADDGFFELGGHSLLAVQIAERLHREDGLAVEAGDVLAHPTVAGLVARLAAAPAGDPAPALPPIAPAGDRTRAPLSLQQEQVWFLDRMEHGNPAYHTQTTLRIVGPLDHPVLELAVTRLTARHAALRTTFEDSDGECRQLVHDPYPVPVSYVDVSGEPDPLRATERLVAGELGRPFDPARLPLVRWTLIRLGTSVHELVLVEHHLVHDGWSFALLMRELTELYTALVENRAPALAPADLQYPDYVRWQRDALDSPAMRRQLEYWLDGLAGPPPVLALPTDRPRPPVQRFRGGVVRRELDPALVAALRHGCQRLRASLFTILLAGYAAVLFRHTGEGDLWIGSGFGNRRPAGTDRLVGMLVNTVVLRFGVTGQVSFRDLVAQAASVLREASDNQELPFVRLVQELNPTRDASTNPLFQTMFSVDDAATAVGSFGTAQATVFERHNGSAKVDLNVLALPRLLRRHDDATLSDGRIGFMWEYNSDLFDRATIDDIAARYECLLAAALEDPERAVGRLALLPANEERALRGWGRGGEVAVPPVGTIHEIIAERAAADPAAIAVTDGRITLTRRQLEEEADHLATRLRALGVRPENGVGLCLTRSVAAVVAILAVLKAGGAYTPMDPRWPHERLAHVLAETRAPVVLCGPELTGRFAALPTTVLAYERDRARRSVPHSHVEQARPDLAYVMYTSGSTGQPKGVRVSHSAVLSRLLSPPFLPGPEPEVVLAVGALPFDASVLEIFAALLNGHRLAVYPDEVTTESLASFVTEQGVTVALLTTALLHAVVDEAPATLEPLRVLLTGGDQLSVRHAAAALRRLHHGRLVNLYGPTEATVFATAATLVAGCEPEHRVPIGTPVPGAEVLLLDRDRQPVPTGVPGELHIGGTGLARDYTGPARLTAERFVPHPTKPGQRLYRSGDLARWRRDGSLEFLGRLDRQVKVRGARVETGEVEHVLRRHPAVRDAVVVAHGPETGKRLLAHVVYADHRPAPAVAGLREHCARFLPEYMIPDAFLPRDELPRTAHGKVDLAALPVADQDTAITGGYLPPRTAGERVLCAIWADVLGVDRVGRTDNFFALGGHSLLAGRIVARVRQQLGHELSLGVLFERATVAELAQALRV